MGAFDHLIPAPQPAQTAAPVPAPAVAPAISPASSGAFDHLIAEANDPSLRAQRLFQELPLRAAEQFRGLNIVENDPNNFAGQLDRRQLSPQDRQSALDMWAQYQTGLTRSAAAQSTLGRIGMAANDAVTTAARGTFVGPWIDELGGAAQGAIHAVTGLGRTGEQETAAIRATHNAIDQQAPVISGVGQLAGGLVSGGIASKLLAPGAGASLAQKAAAYALGGPLAGVAPAEGFLARRAQNVATGALYGANYGAGNADGSLADRAQGAVSGAEGGALVGGALDAGLGAARALVPKLLPNGISPMAQKIAGRAANAEAFTTIGAEPFAPALGDEGTARAARTIEAMPVLGRIVESPKTAVEQAARDAQARLVQTLAAPSSDEAAGTILQRGLQRQRTAGISDLPVGDVRALGVEPTVQATRQNTMSSGAIDRLAQGEAERQLQGVTPEAVTSRGVTVPAARPLSQTQIIRRSAAGTPGVAGSALTDAELSQAIRPEVQTALRPGETAPAIEPPSFAARQEALYEHAARQIPEFRRVDGRPDPALVATTNLGQAVKTVEAQAAHDISGQSTITGDLADRLRNASSNMSFNDIRAIRTEIGRKLGSFNPIDARLDRSQLKTLYAGASRDMENALVFYGNKARVLSRASNANNPSYVTPEAAARAEGALRSFRVADRYTRMGMDRMDRFSTLLGARTPDQAARAMGTKLRESTSDFGSLRSAFSALHPEERQQMAGYIIGSLGRGRPGSRDAETVFNFSHWTTDWEKMGGRGQALLLSHVPVEARASLQALAKVADRMKFYEKTKNFSGSAYSGASIAGVAAMFSGVSGFMSALGSIGTAAAVGKFLTSKLYVRWLTTSMQQGHAGPATGIATRSWNQLRMIAASDPAFGKVVLGAIRATQQTGANPVTPNAALDLRAGRHQHIQPGQLGPAPARAN